MRTKSTTTSLLTAALLALFINTSVLAQNGPGGTFSGRITGLTNSGSDSGAANGLSTAVGFEPVVESLSPNRACTAMNFAVQVDVAPGNSRSRTFSLVINGVVSSLISCRISGPSSLSCDSGSATQIVPARATLAITETTAGGGVGGTAAAFGWECNSTTATPPVTPPVVPAPRTESAGGSAAEVAECKRILQTGTVSWGGGQIWAPANIDNLCNGTRNANNTIACFKAAVNIESMGWAAAIDRCK
jgi:hypothetical protein